MSSYEEVLRIKEKHKIDLMSIGATTVSLNTGQKVTRLNVVGVGVGRKLVKDSRIESFYSHIL